MKVLTAAALILGLALPAAAQRLPQPFVQPAASQTQRPDTGFSDGGMVAGGILGIVGGASAGAMTGVLLEGGLSGGCRGEFGCLGGGLLGFFLGEPVGVAAGVHWANRSRGAYGTELAANLAILAGGLLLGSQLSRGNNGEAGGYVMVIGVPIAQIAASIAIEKATSRPRD